MRINPCLHQPCKIKEKIKTRYDTVSCHDHCPFHKMYQNQIRQPKKEYIGIDDDAYPVRELDRMRKGSSRGRFYRKR